MSVPETTNQDDELLRVEYVPLDLALLWDDNKKVHSLPHLIASIERYGFKDPPKFEPHLNDKRGGIVEGNGRFEALAEMRRKSYIAGVMTLNKSGYRPGLQFDNA